MSHNINLDFDNDDDGLDSFSPLRNVRSKKAAAAKKPIPAALREKSTNLKMVEQTIVQEMDRFSYQPSRHERQWITDSLGEFYEQRWFDDILAMVKGGKEASVYLCRAHPSVGKQLLAAKVYRPRMFRNLRKDHLYREGREQVETDGKLILDDGMLHAMSKRTHYGMELLHQSWLGHEFKTMKLLYKAGADIPRPYASGNNAILMDYIGDETSAAPTLNSVSLTSGEARELFERVIHNVEILLNCNRVHADLSAYNILYWEGQITLIDFPQAINPEENQNAYRIFARDIQRVCEYFSNQGVKTDAPRLAEKLWLAKGRKIIPDVQPLYLDPEKSEDRRIWEKQSTK